MHGPLSPSCSPRDPTEEAGCVVMNTTMFFRYAPTFVTFFSLAIRPPLLVSAVCADAGQGILDSRIRSQPTSVAPHQQQLQGPLVDIRQYGWDNLK